MKFRRSAYEAIKDTDEVGIEMALSQPSSESFEVMISTIDITAICKWWQNIDIISCIIHFNADGVDYTRDFTTVSIAAGEIRKSFNISIISDNITECDETFKLTLNIPASTCGVVNGKTDTTEVTIKDDGRNTIIIITLMLYAHACIDL